VAWGRAGSPPRVPLGEVHVTISSCLLAFMYLDRHYEPLLHLDHVGGPAPCRRLHSRHSTLAVTFCHAVCLGFHCKPSLTKGEANGPRLFKQHSDSSLSCRWFRAVAGVSASYHRQFAAALTGPLSPAASRAATGGADRRSLPAMPPRKEQQAGRGQEPDPEAVEAQRRTDLAFDSGVSRSAPSIFPSLASSRLPATVCRRCCHAAAAEPSPGSLHPPQVLSRTRRLCSSTLPPTKREPAATTGPGRAWLQPIAAALPRLRFHLMLACCLLLPPHHQPPLCKRTRVYCFHATPILLRSPPLFHPPPNN
jgi:hypothetical protein